VEHLEEHASSLTEEQRYRLNVDNPRDVIYRSAADGTIRWISPSVSGILGWEPAELAGRLIDSLVHPQDMTATAEYRMKLRSGQPVPEVAAGVTAPMRIQTKDGDYRWVSVIATPLTNDEGAPDGVVGRLRDVHDLVNALEQLRISQELTQGAFDKLLDPLLVMRPVWDDTGSIADFEYLEANPAACEYNGMAHADMVGARLLDLNPGNLETGEFDQIVRVFETGEPLVFDGHAYDQELRGGERRYYDLRVARAGDLLIYTWRDVTDRRRVEREIAEREDLYRLVTEDVTDAVVRYDDGGTITWVSPSFEGLTGFPPGAIIGKSGMNLLPPEQVPQAEDLLRRRVHGEETGQSRIRMSTVDGSTRWVQATSRPFTRHDGSVDGHVAVLRDITDAVAAEARRDHEIGHDSLTGLANRSLAIARIDRALDELRGSRSFVALLCVGVDRLSTVNQALSFAAGDLVLTTVATRIASAVGDPDLIARVAGDEFVVLLTGLRTPAEAASVAEALCKAAQGPLTVHDQTVEPTVSIGVAIGDRGSNSEDLLRKASLAVQQAKEAGRNRWQFIDPLIATEARRRLQVEAHLRGVLREGHVTAWFQPIVALADRRLRGYEALARLAVPGETVISPADFLPVAEITHQIVGIDLEVLGQALDLAAVSPVEHVAVNVSAPTLSSGEYPDRFAQAVLRAGVDARRLRLEVTETALLGMTLTIVESMRSVAELGATWYVDDFGTGFSSISHLRDLPVRGLKLDRSFTAGIRTGDHTCIKLAQGLIGLAEGLGLDTVAEGIETEFEAGALLGQGWNLGQGWLFGRPAPRGDEIP
jgi:diguanylate cyclase (GGDEF)-like protein/PAS domain S-box-containing protein